MSDDQVTVALLRLVCMTVRNLRNMTLVGDPAPVVRAVGDVMAEPKVGDLVMEESTIWDTARDEHRLGWLRRKERREIEVSPEERADYGSEPLPTELHWVIEPLMNPGTEFDWHNASFLVVPLGIVSSLRGELITERWPTGPFFARLKYRASEPSARPGASVGRPRVPSSTGDTAPARSGRARGKTRRRP